MRAALLAVFIVSRSLAATDFDLRVAENIVGDTRDILQQHYYDPAVVGPDFRRACAETQANLKNARSNAQAFGMIANLLAQVDVRHVRLTPPPRSAIVQHDWNWTIVGNDAFISWVKPASGADKVGLRLGDQLLAVENLPVNRATTWRISYAYEQLTPLPELRVQVRTGGHEPRWITIPARLVKRGPGYMAGTSDIYRFFRGADAQTGLPTNKRPEFSRQVRGGIFIWRPRELNWRSDEVTDAIKAADGCEGMIIDLRGIYGGDYDNLERACELLIEGPVEICDLHDRYRKRRLRSAGGHRNRFTKRIIVLIDAHTESAAEVFAHALQQSSRALLMGDRTAGSVQEDVHFSLASSRGSSRSTITLDLYGVVLPKARVLLPDGTSLDGRGVPPDWQALPKPEDFREKRDVVMSRALAQLKVEISPTEAANIFPIDEKALRDLGSVWY